MASPEPARRVSLAGLLRAAQPLVFFVLPVAFTALGLVHYARRGVLAIDFHRQYWVVGRRVLDGLNPYDRGWQDIPHGVGFPYSALDSLLFAPIALLPHTAADWIFTFLTIAACLATLWVLGVRDLRVYGVALLWAPVVSAWQTANLTLLLGLGIAWLWRMRDRPLVAGALVALLVTVKVFVWPLAVWLLATRRYAAFAYAIAVGAVLNVLTWAVIGFDRLSGFRTVSRDVTQFQEGRSYNVLHLALTGGLSHAAAWTLLVLATIAICTACLAVGRGGRDADAFSLSIAAALVASPVIWLHYFALLIVPLALAFPRLSVAWLIPIVLFLCPVNKPTVLQLLLVLAAAAVVLARAVGEPPPARGMRQSAPVA